MTCIEWLKMAAPHQSGQRFDVVRSGGEKQRVIGQRHLTNDSRVANLSHEVTFFSPETAGPYINRCSPALSPPKIT